MPDRQVLSGLGPGQEQDDAVKAPNAKCVVGDPLFKDAANLDFHLQKGSPAINAGVNDGYLADSRDLDGNPRVFRFGTKSGRADIGCYETPWGVPGFLLMLR